MIVIIDYGLGNLFSVANALQTVGADVRISDSKEDIANAERIVLPGIGAFGDGMKNLEEKGLIPVLQNAIVHDKKPFLGICLGLQVLADRGREHGLHEGLHLIGGSVEKLAVESAGLKVPHIGWNEVVPVKKSPLFSGIKDRAEFYFVHSYHLVCHDANDLLATAEYGGAITVAIERENIAATQFHPEKSQDAGLKFLENFIHWTPS